MGFSDSSA